MKRNKCFLLGMLVLSFAAFGQRAAAAPTSITTCGDLTQPGSYVLANNLSAAPHTPCLGVLANDVTIDLSGFTIDGQCDDSSVVLCLATSQGIGDGGGPRENVTIRNGTIKRFADGIHIFGNQIKVEHVTLNRNQGTGIYTVESATITDNVVNGNRVGIQVGSASVVTGNTVGFNSSHAIVAGPGSTLRGNSAVQNGGDGFQVEQGSTIVNNSAYRNTGAGFRLTCGQGFAASNLFANTGQLNFGGNLVSDCSAPANNVEHNLLTVPIT